jgi:hypothetical protein
MKLYLDSYKTKLYDYTSAPGDFKKMGDKQLFSREPAALCFIVLSGKGQQNNLQETPRPKSISSGRCKFGGVYLHIDARVKRSAFRPPLFSSGTYIFSVFSLLYFSSIL